MINKHRIIKIIAVIVFVYAALAVFFPKLSGTDKYKIDLLDNDITVTVQKADGTVTEYDDNYFPVVGYGDIVTAKIFLPKEYRIDDGKLCFYMDHSYYDVYFDGEVIYSAGHELADKGRQMGGTYPAISIPEGAWGQSVTIVCHITEDNAFSKVNHFTIMPGSESYKYVLIGHLAEFIVFSTVAFISVILLICLIVAGRYTTAIRQGMCIAMFGISVSIWILCYYGMINFYIHNSYVCGELEYFSIFLMPIPIAAYFAESEKNKVLKRMLQGLMGIFILFFIICTVLNYTTVRNHFCQNIRLLHLLIGIGCFFIIYTCFCDKGERDVSKVIMKYSFIILLIAGVIDVIRFNLDKYTGLKSPLMAMTITPIGVIIFISGLVTSLFVVFTNNLMNTREKEQLTRLATLDVMTGLSNRAECDRYVAELRNSNETEYSVAFLDLNELKKCNDTYGHDAGGRYITMVSSVILECFRPIAFCGRMGGDEFLVIIKGKRSRYIGVFLEEFDSQIERINQTNELGFTISVARGIANSSKKNPIDIDSAIKEADKLMYENKHMLKNK